MRYSSSNSPFSILSIIVAMFLLFYLWIPLFVIFLIGGLIFFIVNFFMAKVSGSASPFNVKIVRIRPHDPNTTQQDQDPQQPIDYIDTTIADKKDSNNK